jgi:hypothetical protein
MAQRESQLVAEGLAGPVPLVEDLPASLFSAARLDVLSGYNTWAADGGLNAECLDEGRPAGQPCIRRYRFFLEGSGVLIIEGVIFSGHGRKLSPFGRKQPIILLIGRISIYIVSGRKPIFSVENLVDLTIEVENNYFIDDARPWLCTEFFGGQNKGLTFLRKLTRTLGMPAFIPRSSGTLMFDSFVSAAYLFIKSFSQDCGRQQIQQPNMEKAGRSVLRRIASTYFLPSRFSS